MLFHTKFQPTGYSLRMLILGLICLGATSNLSAQQPELQKAGGTLELNGGPQVTPVGLTIPAMILNPPPAPTAASKTQIRVNIHCLMLSKAMREAMYMQLGEDNVRTVIKHIPKDGKQAPLDQAVMQDSSRKIQTTSCVSTCVLDAESKRNLLTQVSQSEDSTIAAAPSIILLDGTEGQFNEIVQRPFVVDVTPVQSPKNNRSKTPDAPSQPNIQILDEGTTIRVQANAVEDRFRVATELTYQRIMEFSTQKIFGFAPNTTVHVPRHQIETGLAEADLMAGQTLLIDPYISQEIEVRVDRDVPILGKIPYVNRSFKNTAMAKYKAHWVVLLEPVRMQ